MKAFYESPLAEWVKEQETLAIAYRLAEVENKICNLQVIKTQGEKTKMGLNEIYGSNSQWLKVEDFQGTKPVLTIASAEIRDNTYNGETKKQIVLTFVGKEKKLGLNVTNARSISMLLGTEDFTRWVGHRIKFYGDMVQMQNGSSKLGIRVWPELPDAPPAMAQSAQAPVQAPVAAPVAANDGADDDIPF